MPYRNQIQNFKARTEQEKSDRAIILNEIDHAGDDILLRKNKLAHMTSSGFILNEAMTKTLMVHHNIYKTWAWTGGHADGDRDLLQIAIKEAKEETGVERIKVLTDEMLSLDILTVNAHYKRGEYVSTHLHLSAAYVLIADEIEELKIKHDENSDVRWLPVEDMERLCNEPEIVPVYRKLLERAREIKRGVL